MQEERVGDSSRQVSHNLPEVYALSKREFTIANEYRYNHSGPRRWIISHVLRYKRFIASFVLASIITNTLYVLVPSLTGEAFNVVAQGGTGRGELIRIALTILAVVFCGGVVDLTARLSSEVLGKHLAADARDELYLSLLGKSQTFHNRQRVGDIMARAANDMTQLSNMVSPGLDIAFDSNVSLVMILIFIGSINLQLLLMPLI